MDLIVYPQDSGPKLLGFKGTSVIGGPIEDVDHRPITDLIEGGKFHVAWMYGYDEFRVKSLGPDHFCGQRFIDGQPNDLYSSLEFSSDEKCWWSTGFFYCPHIPLLHLPVVEDPKPGN